MKISNTRVLGLHFNIFLLEMSIAKAIYLQFISYKDILRAFPDFHMKFQSYDRGKKVKLFLTNPKLCNKQIFYLVESKKKYNCRDGFDEYLNESSELLDQFIPF